MKKTLSLLLLFFTAFTLTAQVTTSSLTGKVNDEKGLPIPGTTIIANDLSTGTTYPAVTDIKGYFRLLNLRPGGPYNLEIQSMGYHGVNIKIDAIGLGENPMVNVTLQEESINLSEVTVTAPSVSEKSSQGTTIYITTEQIATLPTVSRSMNDVMALTPQVANTSSGLSIGGGNLRQSYVTVDGASFHNAYGIGGNLPAGNAPLSLDALEAITISIAPYDVRQSGFIGGMINAVTRSGSNDLHVSVYDYFTSDKMNGSLYGTKNEQGIFPERLKINKSLENTIGFSVGGPIMKNKLFYFINFEYQSDIDNGQSRFARASATSEWGSNTQYNRPTVTMMDSIRQYLQHTYGYDPGAYQDYSFSTPDYKMLARLDWNINKDNRLTLRYSNTRHQFFSQPSNSITPLSSSLLYNKNSYGRGSEYALYFESSSYYQQRNFQSAAAELNSRFLGGRLNNTLRAVYSLQHEPRKLTRDVFPTVDILEPLEDGTKAVYTSFGPDPFTYGTGSYVHSFIATEEMSFLTGIHDITAGLQFEFDRTKNGFMQGGAGYYVYNSWDDFVNDATPAAFTITFGNNETHTQAFPSFNYIQNSAYLQDEMILSDRFKLTAGLRLELPVYPSIAEYNTNIEFDSLASIPGTTLYGLSTADMPKPSLNFSPRLGFDWDLRGDRSLMLYGGTGLYTGRLPLVWIVTTVCNSNVAQNQYISYGKEIGFYSSVDEIIANNSDKLFVGDLPAPQFATLMDKELKMPQTWKSSLSLEAHLPYGITAIVEGLFSKDLSSVAITRLGIVQNDSIQLPGEPMKRAHWTSENLKNSINGSVNPYLITNSEHNGYYYSLCGQVKKQFDFGLNLSAAYTFAQGRNVTDAMGDQIMTSYTSNTFGVHGSNSHEIGYSSYVPPHRVLVNASWSWSVGAKTKETVSLYYDGFNHGYVGSDSFTRYSYTISGNVNGDGGANSLVYIPTESELSGMPFVDEANKAAYNEFIKADKYLSSHRGQYAERGGALAPWRNTFNIRYERSLLLCNNNTLSFGIDVRNV
ncbi:MAG: carboxypeptidase regulatory-like domain-containing protein, partial [Bacteroidales bacterium]|nr:carboxypeptidase regulatory-like domain-containing protein [Bacteroidales bacterium]